MHTKLRRPPVDDMPFVDGRFGEVICRNPSYYLFLLLTLFVGLPPRSKAEVGADAGDKLPTTCLCMYLYVV